MMMALFLKMVQSYSFLFINVAVFVVFIFVYKYMGMKKHFEVEPTFTNASYFAAATHSSTGFGDITPKTKTAKWVTFAHMTTVWSLVAIATAWSFDKSALNFEKMW